MSHALLPIVLRAVSDDIRRAVAFERAMSELLSTRRIPFRGGVGFLDEGFPLRYDSNLLWVDRVEAGAAELAAEADAILGGAGLAHRSVTIGDLDSGDSLALGFAELGYAIDTVIAMVRKRGPDRARAPVAVSELTYAEARPLIEESVRREPWATREETVQMLTDYRAKLERAAGARFFVASIDGRPAAHCDLYLAGGEAQIEDVSTLSEFRGRGLASAVVLRAAEEARDAGAEWTFLYADANDWPQHWYRTLGFEPVGSVHTFARLPEHAGA